MTRLLPVVAAAFLASNIGVAQVPSGSLVLQFGPAQPKHEPLQAWVAGNATFQAHLAWLSRNLDLPGTVPVVFESCGVSNAFYHPAKRSITLCYEYIDERHNLIRANLSQPTNEKVNDALIRQVQHVLNHEVGHAIVHQLQLPVLGREEDAADGFSAFILLERGTPADAYSVLQGALSNSQKSFFATDNQADEHSLNDQRFFNLLCWMYGSDPTRFAGYARQGRLPAARQSRCGFEWSQLRSSWVSVLGVRLKPVATVAAAAFDPRPVALFTDKTVQIPAGMWVPVEFHVEAPSCRVSVNVVTTEGGVLDLITMVMDKYSYTNWTSGLFAEPISESGKVRQHTAEVPIKGPGDFVIVLSNKFSILTPKSARASASVRCP